MWTTRCLLQDGYFPTRRAIHVVGVWLRIRTCYYIVHTVDSYVVFERVVREYYSLNIFESFHTFHISITSELVSFTHTARTSLENQRSNTNSILTKTQTPTGTVSWISSCDESRAWDSKTSGRYVGKFESSQWDGISFSYDCTRSSFLYVESMGISSHRCLKHKQQHKNERIELFRCSSCSSCCHEQE